MRKLLVVTILLLGCMAVMAQKQKKKRTKRERTPQQELVYDNTNYLPAIKSVQFYPIDQENALPVIELHSDDQLMLAFDDLRGDVRNYYFSLEHCDADWKPSRLSPLEYAEGFNEERIVDYASSVNTLQPYTHYRVDFPTPNIKPKLAGNYLLKVYEDADKRRLIISRRFYVLAPLMMVSAQFAPSVNVAKRRTNQKINIKVNTGGLTVNNPYQDIRILAMQNQRPDVQQWLTTPHFVNGNELTYNDNKTLDFDGGNEFRYFDLRSLRLASDRVANIRLDSAVHVYLVADENYRDAAYASTFDENGNFFVRNQDKTDADTESDYAWVTFSLVDESTTSGAVYVVGSFNSYMRNEANKMTYDPSTKTWRCSLLLKQGLYDYAYVHADTPSTVDVSFSSGNHFETDNTYQILVYNRRPGTTWDELAGFIEISN
ncbi:type IX secretion system plug protein domain-containing protein [Parapedobacter sp. 10938]|uniref:type IX secretion system plug protein n=1 Tax=Parapedobacter flavus TaxID=3110225 RepID=UPI002DBAEBAC|nr:type IX secretion system plug protein domain-containing protein [Parapedobacter sp. 10938]MEC3880869.1 type IX secretion system plug protein domain-containing protein [Parapedobacter sp. 10938]